MPRLSIQQSCRLPVHRLPPRFLGTNRLGTKRRKKHVAQTNLALSCPCATQRGMAHREHVYVTVWPVKRELTGVRTYHIQWQFLVRGVMACQTALDECQTVSDGLAT